jgi:chorismate synthase
MSRNSIGKNLIVTSFGESHGPFIGVVIDGFPSNITINYKALQQQLNRRKPGQNAFTSPRNEKDEFQIISGVYENRSTGAPITILIPNEDARPHDYDHLKDVFRPGHADMLYQVKYGHRDHRGGGRSSARITAGWVAAGALAQQWLLSGSAKSHPALKGSEIHTRAWVKQIHHIVGSFDSAISASGSSSASGSNPNYPTRNDAVNQDSANPNYPTREAIETSPIRCPFPQQNEMMSAIESARDSGNSLGGIIACVVENVPMGIGEPVFGKLQAVLGHYLLNINAVKGVSFGDGFTAVLNNGAENNDEWCIQSDGSVGTRTNHSGGIIGGISTGAVLYFEVAFKPTSTIKKEQNTLNSLFEEITFTAEGRHDPCVLPRAVPIVEAMTNLALMDLMLEF